MEFLGRIDEESYQKLIRTLQDALPDIQPERSPYIVLKIISKYQVLALQGLYRKQSYELYLMEIRLPGVDPKKIEPVSQANYDECKQFINHHVPIL